MSKRWVRWTVGGLLVVLLSVAGWRLSLAIPGWMLRAEASLIEAAAREGVSVRYAGIKLHLLHLHVSIDNVVVRDALADLPLGSARSIDISVSPLRLLSGNIPVSRIRVRDFQLDAGAQNRALYDRWMSGGMEGPSTSLPEILLVNGSIDLSLPGPIRRFRTVVREIRVREGRFRGTHVTAFLERSEGDVVLPGNAGGIWPFPSVEADLFYKKGVLRVRKFNATRGSTKVRFSGSIDTGRRIAAGRASAELDIADWIRAGAPGGSYVRRVVREGKTEMSAAIEGPWNDPEGTLRLVFKDAGFPGNVKTDGQVQLSLRGRVLHLDRVRAKLWGGVLDADGFYRNESGQLEGKGSLRRVSLAEVPWKSLGVPVSLTGSGNASIRLAGTVDRLEGSVSLALPDGIERISASGKDGPALRFPISLDAGGSLTGGRDLRIDSFRLSAGKAEAQGDGDASIDGETLRLRGSISLPPGKAADYGVDEKLSWEKVAGAWDISGPITRLRGKASLSATALTVRALPPFPLVLKVDGVPSEELHVSADVAAPRFKAMVEGTWTFPFDSSRTASEWTARVRELDLSGSTDWISPVAASVGSDAGVITRYLAGIEGIAQADGTIRVAGGKVEATGRFDAARVALRGLSLRGVRAEGKFGGQGATERWAVRVEGKFGDGAFQVAANGEGGNGIGIEGKLNGIEVAKVFSVLGRDKAAGMKGVVDAGFAARGGPMGWEVPRFTVGMESLTVGPARLSGVRVEGRLGAADGTFTVRSASPLVRIDGEVSRAEGWPAKVSLTASQVPTSLLLAAGGRPGVSSTGVWSAEAAGVVRLAEVVGGGPFSPVIFTALHGSVWATDLSVGDVRFGECRASGRKRDDIVEGEILTRAPDSRLEWSISLREPFAFRIEGPFTLGDPGNGAVESGIRRYSLRGRARIEGALRAMEKTSGTVLVDSLNYREAGFELSGKDLSARMEPTGVRWGGGTILAAGNPLGISGKVSWSGDLDVRVAGKLPASLIRVAVPSVFDRLDGTVTLEARITGNLERPSVVGTGHVEGGTLSFIGYNQLFEGIRAEAVISSEKIVFEHFEAKSGGGYLDGWGEVPLSTDAGQRLYFSVDFLDMRYPYPEDFRPVVQGHVELIGPVDDILVTGDVEVQSARYTRVMYPEKALVDFSRKLSDVVARREKSEFRVRLDINAIADRTIRIKNNLADMKAGGEFKIGGDTRKVVVLGTFDVYEGYVDLYGTRYDLKRVTVDFQDPRRINPRLDARAETKKGGYNIAVLVTGTMEKPEVDFTSDPPLGRTDIVSLLAFGVTTKSLASSVTGTGGPSSTGTGQSSGFGSSAAIAIGSTVGGVDEKIRSTIGLDKFSIETGFSQTTQSLEPRFVVGKSFGDRLSISASQSVGTSTYTSASGELKLWEDVYLQGTWESSTGDTQGQIGGDLKVRYRYRSLKDWLNGKE